MKRTITYKEIMLAFGIVIAVLVALTLWDNHQEPKASVPKSPTSVHVDGPRIAKSLLRIAVKAYAHFN